MFKNHFIHSVVRENFLNAFYLCLKYNQQCVKTVLRNLSLFKMVQSLKFLVYPRHMDEKTHFMHRIV